MRSTLEREHVGRSAESESGRGDKITALAGKPSPLGATVYRDGVNFSVFSKHAQRVELLLFDNQDSRQPSHTLELDPVQNRTYHYWHAFAPRTQAGQIYGYKVDGPYSPSLGLRFDPHKLLLDPYGRGVVVPSRYERETIRKAGDTTASAMKSVVIDSESYDWEGDSPLRTPGSRTIIYELHVRGFTQHPSSGLNGELRGTYAGLIQKIPYLQNLGITAVELLPVFQFDPQDSPDGLVNYWGYAPVSFFAPHAAYSSRQDATGPVDEFRDMVKALHRAGIEVILDVVYNHTAEGDHRGPTLCFRGFDNLNYYLLEGDPSRYANYSGCGNTLNANNPIVRRMISDSVRYWVSHMHVDGLRFDLASSLTRDSLGNCLATPPVLWDVETEPELAGTKLIAEAWDAAGLYQVGSFIGDTWQEWNGRFRDDFRGFFRSEPASVRLIADRFLGSPEIFAHEQREAEQSVNFITCHDGFTVNDLVSYQNKHNESNGENNRDGNDDNRSWNCGFEGPTSDPEIERLRTRQVKNFFAATLLSVGTPMILMGDEVRRTQEGNNNNYCHDDETNWFDWSLLNAHADIHRFVTLLIKRRLCRNGIGEHQSRTLAQLIQDAHKAWHGVKLFQPDWSDCSHSIALSAQLSGEPVLVHVILNAYWNSLNFELPETKAHNPWRRWIDTALEPPNDIFEWQMSPSILGASYPAQGRSVIVLFKDLVP
jgi:glycogen operon protein